ncbi:MAG TPA: DUF4124 domain-containing protein [Burkholderiales bacterium]|nr:DUF4124 domain-containing protein [Burkholderiales bacterium]
MRSLFVVLLLTTCAGAARAEIYECIDESGNRRFTNIKAEARGCKQLNVGPVNSVPPPAKPVSKSGTPASFPKVDAQTQQQRDVERRKILEQELSNEQKLLEQARKELAEQESIRTGGERNYQRVLDRLEPFQKRVQLHESNIANLKKELSGLR